MLQQSIQFGVSLTSANFIWLADFQSIFKTAVHVGCSYSEVDIIYQK